jgi:serine/threonine protein phosphatase PrpC
MKLTWSSAAETHPGNHRDTNQDAVLERNDAGLWMVADGMGGHHAGEFASACIKQALQNVVLGDSLSDCVDRVDDALISVNDHLRTEAHQRGQGAIGSTVVALVTRGQTGVAMWAGDSRLYRLRSGRLTQITRDHNPISDLLDRGAVTETEALEADTNVITRAIGGQRRLVVDIAVFDVQADDTYLLCSDGLYRERNRRELSQELDNESIPDAVRTLMADGLAGEARDNISIVVARAAAG